MRAVRLALVVALASLLVPLAVVSNPAGASSQVSAQTSSAASAPADKGDRKRKAPGWAPPPGALLSDPTIAGKDRNILHRVIRSIYETGKGEYIRVVVWNYDDRRVTNALLDADRRGVHVQVVVAGSVKNPNYSRTRAQLNRSPHDRSFALRCAGGCRSKTKVMHSKYILFSRIHRVKNISMFGSFNLTTPAGNRQWNDMVTSRNYALYRELATTFEEYARDRAILAPHKVTDLGKYKVTLFPAFNTNPILDEFKRVRCGPAGDRTKIRIAIAGWFDAFGSDIARRIRYLWEHGCNIKIITTLSGGGVNRMLRNPRGRGPVPIRQVTQDTNLDGIPERYLHMKNIAISGFYDGDPNANVLITGSPNWSRNAQVSDEIVIRVADAPRMVRQYQANTDRLFAGPFSHWGTPAPATQTLMRGAAGDDADAPNLRTGENVPDWFELN